MAQTAAAAAATIWRGEFDALSAELSNDTPAVAQRREQGMARVDALGLPTTRQELWRFNDLYALTQRQFHRATAGVAIDAAALPPLPHPDAARLVFVNGHYVPSLSTADALAPSSGVSLNDVTAAGAADDAERALPGLDQHVFTALNDAFSRDAATLRVSASATDGAPLHVVHFASGDDIMSFPRTRIALDAGARFSVVEEFIGDGAALCCPLTELSLGDGATLRYYRLQRGGDSSYNLGALRLKLGADADAEGHMVSAGGAVNRVDIVAHLVGERADCRLRGLSLVDDGELSDYHVHVAHKVPNGSSQQIFRGVLDGKSRAVFDGLIEVAQDAQQTAAEQNNRNLLLSKRAIANSIPRLEILADDVRCAHGSTVGFLDPDALFYLRSRGVPEADARALLVYAFANEQIAAVGPDLSALRERLSALLAERFRFDGAGTE